MKAPIRLPWNIRPQWEKRLPVCSWKCPSGERILGVTAHCHADSDEDDVLPNIGICHPAIRVMVERLEKAEGRRDG